MADRIEIDEELNLGSRGGLLAWLESAAIVLLMGFASRLPRAIQRGFVSCLASVAMRLDKRHRDAARSFMAQALGEEAGKDDRRLHQAYAHLFQMSLDSYAFPRQADQNNLLKHYKIKTTPEIEEVLRGASGGFAVSAHIGDWEAAAAIMPHVGMAPSYGVAKPPKNRYLARHLLRSRERKGMTVVPRRGGMRLMPSILKSGGWVVLMLDQRPLGKHIIAPFFGRPTTCERSAAVLFKRMGVPIVFCACYVTEEPFQYELELTRLMRPEELQGMSPEEIVTEVNLELEKLILARPEQYFWLHDRYRDAPPEASTQEAHKSPSPAVAGE
jgi:KDO2-lipid IV(A) lauroyltransferase